MSGLNDEVAEVLRRRQESAEALRQSQRVESAAKQDTRNALLTLANDARDIMVSRRIPPQPLHAEIYYPFDLKSSTHKKLPRAVDTAHRGWGPLFFRSYHDPDHGTSTYIGPGPFVTTDAHLVPAVLTERYSARGLQHELLSAMQRPARFMVTIGHHPDGVGWYPFEGHRAHVPRYFSNDIPEWVRSRSIVPVAQLHHEFLDGILAKPTRATEWIERLRKDLVESVANWAELSSP